MTTTEIDQLVTSLARDLRLSPLQKHALAGEAKRLAGMSDPDLRAAVQEYGTRSVDPLLSGAVAACGCGITEGRFLDSLATPEARQQYVDQLTPVGTLGGYTDSGSADDSDAAELTALAADLDARGDATSRETAARLRTVLERHKAGQE